MKITHNKVGQNLNLTDSGRTDRAGKSNDAASSAGAGKADALLQGDATRVQLSDRAQQMKKAKEIAMATPDVDEAKVAKFQQLIDQGKYKVDAKALADKMVDEELMWS